MEQVILDLILSSKKPLSTEDIVSYCQDSFHGARTDEVLVILLDMEQTPLIMRKPNGPASSFWVKDDRKPYSRPTITRLGNVKDEVY